MRREYYSPVERFLYFDNTQVEWGGYGQAQWGFIRGWVAGLRHGWTSPTDNSPGEIIVRQRLATNLSYYPSEFSKVRLQINLDDGEFLGKETVWGLWLQYEFLMGQHAGHKF